MVNIKPLQKGGHDKGQGMQYLKLIVRGRQSLTESKHYSALNEVKGVMVAYSTATFSQVASPSAKLYCGKRLKMYASKNYLKVYRLRHHDQHFLIMLTNQC